MTPVEKTESALETNAHTHDATHRDGPHSGLGHSHASAHPGEKREFGRGRSSFASAGGWVVSQ